MTIPPGSAEETLDRIDADIAAAQQRAARATEFRQNVERLRGIGRSGQVTVTADATGALLDVELPRNLHGTDGFRLRADVLSAHRAAHADAAAQLRVEAVSTFGADSPLTQRVLAEVDERLNR